jgi:hypothetical protein
MNSLIKRIEIRNFRSLHDVDIDCTELNIFSGLNDSGKSNVLKALNLFFNGFTDFNVVPLDFATDFSKVELAKAQKSSKSKQLIRIKVFLDPPKTFKSLSGENEVFLERVFDRDHNETSVYSRTDSSTVRSSISRLVNRIRYVYIPALKGPNVLQYLLGLLGEQKLIDEDDIEGLNTKINEQTADLSDLLNQSALPFATEFGLPTLLSDFWQRLNVGTLYEEFDKLESDITPSKSAKNTRLNRRLFLIPLISRGDGIKSKFIPPLLQWLNENNSSREFIWGIDEPENSLEFRAAEHLSKLFFSEYPKKNQIFLTSHSLAFLDPPPKSVFSPFYYRCVKGDFGDTQVKTFDELYEREDRNRLFEEIGALEIQKDIMRRWREQENALRDQLERHEKLLADVQSRLEALTRPIIVTEGKTDWRHLKKARERLSPDPTSVKFEFHESEADMGDAELKRFCSSMARVPQPQPIIAIFDRDVEDIVKKLGDGKEFKDWGNNVFSFCIPVPKHRKDYKNISIEFFYQDKDLSRRDQHGRRLFFSNELQRKMVQSLTNKTDLENSIIPLSSPNLEEELEKKVYDQDVAQIRNESGEQVAMSKAAFAQLVADGSGEFAEIEFGTFESIFEIVETIIKNNGA